MVYGMQVALLKYVSEGHVGNHFIGSCLLFFV